MDLPRDLPDLVMLLAVDHDRRRLGSSSDQLGHLIRAAALEQLTIAGRVEDVDGRPRAVGREPVGDPLLDGVLTGIRDAPPKRWKHWVRKDGRAARRLVRDRLEDAGLIAVRRRRLLGLIPADRVTLRAHREVKELRTRTARIITGTEPVTRLDREQAALAALVAVGKLRTVIGLRERWRARARVKQLVDRGGPAVTALRKVIQDDEASAASAAV